MEKLETGCAVVNLTQRPQNMSVWTPFLVGVTLGIYFTFVLCVLWLTWYTRSRCWETEVKESTWKKSPVRNASESPGLSMLIIGQQKFTHSFYSNVETQRFSTHNSRWEYHACCWIPGVVCVCISLHTLLLLLLFLCSLGCCCDVCHKDELIGFRITLV